MECKAAKAKVKEPAFMLKKPKNEREELHQFIFNMCQRPGMYFRSSPFAEAEAMVYGWMRGVDALGGASEWWKFQEWYRVNYPPLGSNSVFGRIAEKYPDEPSRFRRLQFLFNKYIRETEKTPYVPAH